MMSNYSASSDGLGLPHAFALAVIAGILDLIPNIGALLAGIIIGIVALSGGDHRARRAQIAAADAGQQRPA